MHATGIYHASIVQVSESVLNWIVEEINRLRSAGYTYADIAEALSVSTDSVRRWHSRRAHPARPHATLFSLRRL